MLQRLPKTLFTAVIFCIVFCVNSALAQGSGNSLQVNFAQAASYDYAGQDGSGSVAVLDNGNGLRMQGNRVRAFRAPYTVTPATRMSFTFSSALQGEIHAIGMDSDLNVSSGQLFQLYGTQWLGVQNYRDYNGGTRNYDIPVGEYFTGVMNYLVLVMDHDVASATGESVFSDVVFYEANANGYSAAQSSPVVEFVQPLADITVVQGEARELEFVAFDPDADIAYCELLVNGGLWARRTEGPYTFNRFIRTRQPGIYDLTARCEDASGLASTAYRTVTVIAAESPPEVEFVQPLADITVVQGEARELEFVAFDPDADIAYCELLVNGGLWARRTEGPYTFNRFIRTRQPGIYDLTARCEDASGLASTAYRTVTVIAAESPPEVEFVQPLADITVVQGEARELEFVAYDSDGDMAFCELLVNGGLLVRRPAEGPFTFNRFIRNRQPGTYNLTARCEDASGLVSTASRLVTVLPVQSEANIEFAEQLFTSLQVGSDLSVEIISSDNDFVIQNCRLYYNGSLVRQENRAPYQWGPGSGTVDPVLLALPAGSQRLLADCTSTSGERAQIERTIAVGSVSSAQASGADVLLDWIVPTTREDGSALAVAEIDSYVIHYYRPGSTTSYADEFVAARANNGTLATSYILDSLDSGNWAFSIATIDTQGRVSQFATPVNLTIP